jgi:lysophospholipase L1-like esterase
MEGIAYVDVVGALNEQVRQHAQLYPSDSDGHPQAAGYRVIARLVYEAMRRLPPAG